MEPKPKEQVETAPDPEEDDLDDLDDVLDEFSAPKPTSKPSTAAPSASGPGRPQDASSKSPPSPRELPSDAELSAQLQAGMQSLIGELDGNADMQKEFERMMAELIQAGQAGTDKEAIEHIGKATEAVTQPPPPAAGKPDTAGKKDKPQQESFQETIRKTMERMQASGDSASAAAASGANDPEEDMIAQMMKELQAGGEGGGEEDFNKMLMGMMAQLTNKEILYEPMKELHDKFPAWMEKNKDKVEKQDLERYEEQKMLVGEIVGRFERQGYSDEDEGDREYIVERMQKMQAAGSPPPDLVGDMSAAQEALGDLEGGCPTQ